MTHIQNISHIIEHGITHRKSSNADSNYIAIGDVSLIETRDAKQVRITNGDFMCTEANIIVLGDFIPFYFGVKMPMLYVVQNGGNFVVSPTPPEKIVYLRCEITDIINSGIPFCFSDGHPTNSFTQFYDKHQINRLPQIIDWNAVRAAYWGGESNLDTKRKKQAEFFVASDIPPEFLSAFGCYNSEAKDYLISLGIPNSKVIIVPNAYY